MSSDYQTRSKSSQEAHHSGMVIATANSTIAPTGTQSGNSPAKKSKILWPASNEKKKWKLLEDEVLLKIKKVKGSVTNKL